MATTLLPDTLALTFALLDDIESMAAQFPLVQQLNPDLHKTTYRAWLPDMVAKGYKQLVVYAASAPATPIAVCGVWATTKFWCGPHLELDNLVVDQTYRRQGIGEQMMTWLKDYAQTHGFSSIKLDSYHEACQAHQFYQRHGFQRPGYVFQYHVLQHAAE